MNVGAVGAGVDACADATVAVNAGDGDGDGDAGDRLGDKRTDCIAQKRRGCIEMKSLQRIKASLRFEM